MSTPEIRPLTNTPQTRAHLAEVLIATVAAGGSVGFMHPVSPAQAQAFWQAAFNEADAGNRVIFGAWEGQRLLGTVTLLTALPPNQPHRAEIAKMMTHPQARQRGIATRLIQAAEAEAAARGKTLLVLDTASDEGAGPFYEKMGYSLSGEIPEFALKPHGGLTGTLLYWKRLS
ncbi:GNAT family N-acetyltransferase [Deinococcus fonticola]|uniref:GNAT family N-acetyltransferase n=1 Tax=Deinococcus fonticola TaxID=2528713 RepID=UPI0010757D83|nr:GNAT family N-acetyltransferase [Deinococcus fonticola]